MERKVFIDKMEYLTRGSEAEIFKLYDGNIFKEFIIETGYRKRKIKEKRLSYLEELDTLKAYYPKIHYYVDSLFRFWMSGYVMEPVCGGFLSTRCYSVTQVLELLDDLRKIIDAFRLEGVYYYDIREPNILVGKDHTPILLDIDRVILDGEKKLDATPLFLKQYLDTGGKLGFYAQVLMFNLFTRCAFRFTELEGNIEYDKVGLEIMQTTKFLDSAYDHEYLYEHMKVKK